MDDDKDRDIPNAPLPPHERGWRHPAEIGEWSRTTDELISSAPPLSRRLTAVIAGLSLVLSLVVVAIAIPREGNKVQSSDISATSIVVRSQTLESAFLAELENIDSSEDAVNLTPGDVVYLHSPLLPSPVSAVIGIESSHRDGFYPLNVSEPVHEFVLVSDENDRVIGIAKTIQHQTWFISKKFIGAFAAAELGR